MRIFLFVLMMGCFCIAIRAQELTGRVTSNTQEGLAFVTVTLSDHGTVIGNTVTGKNGRFVLRASLKHREQYELLLSSVGYLDARLHFVYTDTLTAFNIRLQADPKTLAGLTINGKKEFITRKSDRFIVNVEHSALANGLVATEILQRTPGVWVDNNGNIRLRGNQPVTIMVNDVVQRLGAEELADFVRSLKSENISRIEVITNPPAEFEAAGTGGIVHIVLKRGKQNGWSGSVHTQYWQQGQKPYVTAGASVNRQQRKLYLSGTYNYVRDLRSIRERTILRYPDYSGFENHTDRDEKISRHQYRLAAIYDLDAKHTMGIQSSFSKTDFQHLFSGHELYSGLRYDSGEAVSRKQRMFTLGAVTLHHTFKPDTSGTVLKLLADYSSNIRNETNRFFKTNTDTARQRFWRNEVPVNTDIFTLQSDFVKPLKRHTLVQAGIKYAFIKRNNLLTTEDSVATGWQPNPGQSSHFLYTERLWMAYTAVEKTIRATTLKAGLRTEQTFSAGHETNTGLKFSRQYIGFFPSLSLMQALQPHRGTAITVSYSRRLTRPALNELNPARLAFNNYTSLTGNPALLPQYSHHFSLAWQFLKKHSVDVYFMRTNNFIALSANPGPGNSIEYKSENTGSVAEYGISYGGTLLLWGVWRNTNNIAIYRSAYRFNNIAYRQTSMYARSVNTITIATDTEIDCVFDYRSPYVYTNLYTYGNFEWGGGITKKMIGKKMSVRLSVTDILNSSREKEWTEEKGSSISFYRKRPTRTLRLSISYSLNTGRKMQNKIVEQAGIEERRRIGN